MTCCSSFSLLAGVGLVLLNGVAMAGTEQWVCSITDVVECVDGGDCGPPDFHGATPPTFFHVDLDQKAITLLEPGAHRCGTSDSVAYRRRELVVGVRPMPTCRSRRAMIVRNH
jgi:hypothetical protein